MFYSFAGMSLIRTLPPPFIFFCAHVARERAQKNRPKKFSGGSADMRQRKSLSAPLLCVPGFPLVCSETEDQLLTVAKKCSNIPEALRKKSEDNHVKFINK